MSPEFLGTEEDKKELGEELVTKIEKYLREQEPEQDLKGTVIIWKKIS